MKTPERRRRKLERAAHFRDNPTRAEAILWEHLKDGQLGVRFEFQKVISGWIADFYCPEHRLVVEVDGSSHLLRKHKDRTRDRIMRYMRMTVLRIKNEDVYSDVGACVQRIKQLL